MATGYILYRTQSEKMRNIKSAILPYNKVANDYVTVEFSFTRQSSTFT